ncbi:MAG: hypothetical protein Q8P07_04240 [bacterium]|nr:hypothetical protein [bacterium]
MSQKEINQIEKNLKKSADLHQYIIKHPEVLEDLPGNVQIIMDNDTEVKIKKDLYKATKHGSKWILSPVGV